jgi:hypothetical protein
MDTDWISLGTMIPGNDGKQSIAVPENGQNGFYRVLLQ